MGLRSWFRKRRVSKAVRTLNRDLLSGKATDDLQREGGWDFLAGKKWSWTSADDIWASYTVSGMEQVYKLASIVYACVRFKCVVAPEAWMEVGEYDGNTWEPIEEHGFYDLIRRPNGAMDRRQYLWNIVSHYELTGESWVWKVRNRAREIIALQPLPTSWPRAITHRGKLLHYDILRGSEVVARVPPEDMMVGRYPDPADPTKAVGPLHAALKDLQIDDARADLLIEILSNIHFPGMIFTSKGMWTQEQVDQIKKGLRDIVGPGKRGDAMFLAGVEEGKVEMPKPPSDLDWPGTASLSETRVCSCYGLSPIILGLRSGLERSTMANFETSLRAAYQTAMRPLWQQIASDHEKGLFLDEGDRETQVEPNWDDVPEMQEDLDSLHARAREDYHAGLINWNRAREIITEPSLDEPGEEFVRPMNLIPVIAGEETAPPEPGKPEQWDEDEETEETEGVPGGEEEEEE